MAKRKQHYPQLAAAPPVTVRPSVCFVGVQVRPQEAQRGNLLCFSEKAASQAGWQRANTPYGSKHASATQTHTTNQTASFSSQIETHFQVMTLLDPDGADDTSSTELASTCARSHRTRCSLLSQMETAYYNIVILL